MTDISDDRPARQIDRAADLCGRKDSRIRKRLVETWNEVKRGFEDQGERANNQDEYWDAYNCRLGDNQYYEGDAQIYIPIIRDAVNARATRFINQLFPQGGQYVEAVSADGAVNGPIADMLEQYIRDGRVKTEVAKALCRNGDIEGQYNLYMDWSEISREIVSRETRPAMMPGAPPGMEMPIPGEEEEDVAIEEIIEGRPVAEVLHDSDVLVLPASADSVEEALAAGGLVAIVRRWSKGKLQRLAEAGVIRKDAAAELEDQMSAWSKKGAGMPPDAEKALAESVGIRKKGTEAAIWEVWRRLPLSKFGAYNEDSKGTRDRLCRMFFGPDEMVLGCARNPNWNDRCPLLSVPVEKISGVFKGRSQVEPVASLQYEANDAANEGADAAHYSAMPVVFRDPASGNDPIILNIGAVIDAAPNAIKFAEWPDLTPRAITRIQYCIAQIFQSLGVNPSMLPQQTSASRRNQAQVAQEQAVDLLTTAEAVSVLEEGVFTPMVGWWVDLDYQYRDRELTVRTHGARGVRANMQPIPPFKNREYYRFAWWGADQARYNAMHYQQEIAWLNVANSLGPALAQEGKRINFTPILEASAGAIFGPKYRGHIIVDLRAQLSLEPEIENQMLAQGDEVPVSIFDDDARHLQAHQQAAAGGDPTGAFRLHIQRHMMAMAAKQQAMVMSEAQRAITGGEQQGRPSRGGQGPRPGGQPGGSRPSRGPPGMIHPDAMPVAGGIMMPRKS